MFENCLWQKLFGQCDNVVDAGEPHTCVADLCDWTSDTRAIKFVCWRRCFHKHASK